MPAESREIVVSLAAPSSIVPAVSAADVPMPKAPVFELYVRLAFVFGPSSPVAAVKNTGKHVVSVASLAATIVGRPVQFVSVPLDGVPSTGVVNVGLVSVFAVRVWVPPTVTTEAVFAPAFVTRRSPVPTVKIPVVCVATQSLFSMFQTKPVLPNRFCHPRAVVPNEEPPSAAGDSAVLVSCISAAELMPHPSVLAAGRYIPLVGTVELSGTKRFPVMTVPVIVVPVIAAALAPPITVPSTVPPLMSVVVSTDEAEVRTPVDELNVRFAFVFGSNDPDAAVANPIKHVVSDASFDHVTVDALPVRAPTKDVDANAPVEELNVRLAFVFGPSSPVAAVKKAGKHVASVASFAAMIEGKPVQFVNVPDDGVPRTGVVRVGLVNVLAVSV